MNSEPTAQDGDKCNTACTKENYWWRKMCMISVIIFKYAHRPVLECCWLLVEPQYLKVDTKTHLFIFERLTHSFFKVSLLFQKTENLNRTEGKFSPLDLPSLSLCSETKNKPTWSNSIAIKVKYFLLSRSGKWQVP